ncbi:MAG TPA: DRTGG domain-containing protein [Dehalococcoidales bacterium]|nr:DRTGG domain-containing protein [Dehalococcoidales bacterium]
MKTIIVGSIRENAGKTSFIAGLGKTLGCQFAYLKPFGDRLLYRKKRLWDYDSALITGIFELEQNSEDITLGFEHARLRFMYDEAGTKNKVQEMARNLASTPLLIVEGGKDLTCGTSVRLDTISLVKYLGGQLILIISGDEGSILDDIVFVKKYVDMTGVDLSVIINKVNNLEDYKANYLRDVQEMGVKVLGVIPNEHKLTQVAMGYIAEKLQARILSGEGGLNKKVNKILVGAMGGDAATRYPLWKSENKLAITSGDRSDYILAALESSTAGVILTNNFLPTQNLISRAAEKNIPMLLVPFDTFTTAKQVDDMVPLLTREDNERLDLLQDLVSTNVNVKELL